MVLQERVAAEPFIAAALHWYIVVVRRAATATGPTATATATADDADALPPRPPPRPPLLLLLLWTCDDYVLFCCAGCCSKSTEGPKPKGLSCIYILLKRNQQSVQIYCKYFSSPFDSKF